MSWEKASSSVESQFVPSAQETDPLLRHVELATHPHVHRRGVSSDVFDILRGGQHAKMRVAVRVERRRLFIASLVTEFHFQYSETLPRLAVAADIERIRYTGLWLREHNYTSFQYAIHPGTHYGYRGGLRTIHPDLEAAGMRPDVCCYLTGFVREDLVR